MHTPRYFLCDVSRRMLCARPAVTGNPAGQASWRTNWPASGPVWCPARGQTSLVQETCILRRWHGRGCFLHNSCAGAWLGRAESMAIEGLRVPVSHALAAPFGLQRLSAVAIPAWFWSSNLVVILSGWLWSASSCILCRRRHWQ